MKKINRVFSLVLILSIALGLFVSCPNNTIAGSVERDGRNNAETLITGTINKPLTDSRKFTIMLNNATFRAFSRGEDVSSWFVDSEGNPAAIVGLKYRIASPVASGSNKATVRITGTPEVASKEQIHLLIPCDTFQGPVMIDVDTEGALRYNIIDYIEPTLTLIKEDGNNLVVDGMETKAIDEKRIKFQLNNAHFANSLKGNISASDGGDGSIVGAKSAGVNFDDSTTSTHLDFKWEIIKNPDGDNYEIDLVVTGTADTLRSQDKGDTFTITLIKELLYDGTDADGINSTPTIIDDNNGEAYVKDIKVVKEGTTTPEVGVYNFTEVVPTLVLVEKDSGYTNYLSSWNKLAKKEISGTTDKTVGLGFNSVELYYLLNDATVVNTSTSSTFTSDNVDSLFGEGFSKTGLIGSISVLNSILKDDNGTNIENSPVLFSVIISKGTEDLHVSEGDFNFVLTDELITIFGIKKTGATENYDKPIKSSGIISIKIEEPKPAINNNYSDTGVYFTATTLDVVSDNPYNESNGVNGGVVKLLNYSTFRYKAEYATGEEVKIDGENSLVKIEPTYDYMTYYYKILTSDDDIDTASIQLYVKSNPDKYEDNDPEEGLLTPPSIDVTYTDPTGSYKDTQSTAQGSFKSDKKDKYQVQVTLSSKLFEQVDTGETTTQAESDTETKWKDYTGSDVIITKESNWVRYRIREKKTENLSVPSWQRVSYTNADGDEYAVNYDNRSPFSYLKDSDTYTTYTMNWDVHNQSNPYIWAVIPNAIPTSSKGTLASVKLVSKDNYEKNFQNNFNAQLPPKEYFKKSKTASSDPSYLYGRAVVGEGSSTESMSYQNIALNRFEIVTALPNGYTLSSDINENDVRIFNGVAHTEYSDSLGGKTRINVLYNDDELKILNDNMKFKVALDGDASAVIPSWGNKVAYVYLDSLTNEDDKLVKLLSTYYDDSNGSSSKTYTKIPMLTGVDIRINPSKLISTTDGQPFLSAKKALKTVDGSTYDGDVSKLLNADMWISVSSSNDKVYARKYIDGEAVDNYYYKPNNMLIIYVIPNEYEYKYGDGGTPDTVKIKSLSWNYRIMDRADYSYLTAYQFPEAYGGDYSFSYWMFQNYRHTPNSLSINADMTTGLTKTVGKGLYLDMDGVTQKEYTVPEVSSSYRSMVQFYMTTPLNLSSLVTENSWYQMHKVREVPIDGSSIPIRELKSGSFEQDVYNNDNREGRTIPGTDLLGIAKAAKRKGYRVKGFSRGRNHYNGVIPRDGAYYGTTLSKSIGTANIISDLVPYKGFDDFGEPVDWEIKWNGNVMDENSPVFTKGITLELTDALAYRRYILRRDSSDSASNYLLRDWYNTTYIYLVWEIDPNSPYYSLQSNTATDPGQLKFVRIPGDLQWPGYRNPYYDDGGKLVYLDYSSGPFHIQNNTGGDRDIGTGVGAEFNNVGRIAKYDFEIADREMYAELFETVYQWATTKGGYDFTSSSEEKYKPVDRNDYEAYDWNPSYGETSPIVEETSSFDESKIYGGVRTVASETSSVGTYSSVTVADKGNHPVTNVNIYDAMLFCNALTDYANDVLGVTPKLTKAYGDVKTYSDIKGKLNYKTIHNAPESTGYRLPTYNEWFAAATIVPDTDDYLMTATSTNFNEFTLAYNGDFYYDYHGELIGTGIVEKSSNSSSGSTYGPSLSGKLYDTVYPFMQSLNGFSGVANEPYVHFDSPSSSHIRDSEITAKYAWTLGTKASGKSHQTRSVFGNEVLPNSLGLYDMSGNVSEWVLGTGEVISDVDNPTQTEMINNYPGRLGLIAVVGGDWAGEYYRSNLYQQGASVYESKGDVWYYLPPMDRMYDENNYWTVRYKNTSVGNLNSRMLEYNQRSYNIGFRVCRTIKDSTV